VTRDIGSSAQDGLSASTRRVFDLISIKSQDGNNLFVIGTDSTVSELLFTNCEVNLTHAGETFNANLGYIAHSPITESSNAINEKVSFTIDGVDLSNAETILNANFIGANANIKKVVVGADYSFTSDEVYEVFDGFINSFNLTADKETANLRLECGGPFSAFEKNSIYGYASVLSHQVVFNNDKGFEFSNKTLTDLQWGKQ